MKWKDIFVDIETLSPGGCLSLSRGIYMCKIMKKSIKSDFKEIFLNLQQMTEVTRCSCIKSDFKEISLKLATNG